MPKFTLVVYTNPVPGREDEFNEWYTNTHIPDALRGPGMVSARRYRRTAQQRWAGPHQWEYLAIYECDAPEPQVVTDGIQQRLGTPEMLRSDAMAEVSYGCYFEPITEVISRPGGAD